MSEAEIGRLDARADLAKAFPNRLPFTVKPRGPYTPKKPKPGQSAPGPWREELARKYPELPPNLLDTLLPDDM
jgi:hypothetical protein